MTPKELCDLAATINAAVPGLVPSMRPNEFEPEVDPSVRIGLELRRMPDAAALLLGRCEAWLRSVPQIKEPSVNVVLAIADIGDVLSAYVAATLPGAKS